MLALLAESSAGELVVPPTIQALLAARLDHLDPAERAVLARGAVEGRVFHRGAVSALSAEEQDLDPLLMGLVRKELVRPVAAQVRGEDAFRFRHQLIRDAAYDGLSKQDRAALHESFAGWLAAAPDGVSDRDELLGYHLEQAYRYRAALGPTDAHGDELASAAADRLAAAGRRAVRRDDAPAAARLLERAAAVMTVESPAKIEVLLDLGRALDGLGGPRADADSVLTDAARLAEKLGDVRLQTHAQIELTLFRAFSEPEGKSEELRRVAEEAIPVFTALDDEKGLVAAWFSIAVAEMTWGQSGAQQEAIEQALLHARRCGDPWLERQAAWGLGMVLIYGPTHVGDALRRCSELREQLPGSILFDASYLATQAVLEAMSGNFETARRHVAQTRAVVAEFGFEGFLPGELFWSVEMLAGDPVAAERAIRPEYERLTASGEKGLCAGRATFLAEALYEQGRDEEAEASQRPPASSQRATTSPYTCSGSRRSRRSSPGAGLSRRPSSSRATLSSSAPRPTGPLITPTP